MTARVDESRGRIVNTTAELERDRDSMPIATASALSARVSADVEAAWRTRYLQDTDDPEANDGS